MHTFKVVEDTFTPWAETKIGEMEYFQKELMVQLSTIFLEETDPYVPVLSGSLLESAHYLQVWSALGLYTTVQFIWSGLFNPNYEEFKEFGNISSRNGELLKGTQEDYALSVYGGQTYKKRGTPQSDHWVDQSIATGIDEIQATLEEQLKLFFMK